MSESTHGGKGDRPRKVNKEKYEANWNAIFGKKKLPTEKLNPESKSSKKGDSN
tara:strand:- start:613 stop:771 length:159 start_codon:yes stop_codon:yes gene_type:complete